MEKDKDDMGQGKSSIPPRTLIATFSAKTESLGKLYVEGPPAELSSETIAKFCQWLWGEYQSLPLNVEFSWYERYSDVAEMFADIEDSHIWVSPENYDTSLDVNPIFNFILQAIHDNDHYLTKSDFSLDGEIATYKATARRTPTLEIQKILYSESVLKPAASLLLGHTPVSKIVFP